MALGRKAASEMSAYEPASTGNPDCQPLHGRVAMSGRIELPHHTCGIPSDYCVGRHIASYDGTGAHDRALSYCDSFQDTGAKSDPGLVPDHHPPHHHVFPRFLAPMPQLYVRFAQRPEDRMGIVIDDGHAPGDQHVGSNGHPRMAYDVTCADIRPVADRHAPL